ncbi:MAG: outer membrane lipoprotein LolB [Betaproteobacteria bacterium]|nr:MAG: outer membrane lipoprotein LolB [Betaproteobacteria bacterium]
MVGTALHRVVLVGLIALAGCATPPPAPLRVPVLVPAIQPLTAFTLEGRIALRTGDENISGGLRWTRQGSHDHLVLTTPMGGAVAEVLREGERVEVTDHKGQRRVSMAGLAGLDELVGVKLPLDELSWWLAGAVRVGVPHRATRDDEGRLAYLEYADWRIDLRRYQSVGERSLPHKLTVRRGDDFELRLVVDQWQIP